MQPFPYLTSRRFVGRVVALAVVLRSRTYGNARLELRNPSKIKKKLCFSLGFRPTLPQRNQVDVAD